MAAGNWNSPSSPAHVGMSRAEMGWIEPQLVIGDFSNLSIPAIETTPFALKIKNDLAEYLRSRTDSRSDSIRIPGDVAWRSGM